MPNYWNSESDMVARIREVRHIMELLTREEMRLINDLASVRGQEDYFVSDKGIVALLGAKPKPVKPKKVKVEAKIPAHRRGKPVWVR